MVILLLSGCYEIQRGSCKHQPGFCVGSGPDGGLEAALLYVKVLTSLRMGGIPPHCNDSGH